MNVKHFTDEKVLLFEITEEIDHHSSEKIKRRVDYEIQRLYPTKIVFDFDNVFFMDSAGIGLLLGRYKTAVAYGAKIELINVKDRIKEILVMSGISKVMKVA